MKYNCICKKEFEPDHYYMNGNSTLRAYTKGTKFIAEAGSSFTFTVKPNEYSLTSEDGVYQVEMTRECFMEYFTIKSFIRNKKLEELGII